MITSMTGFGAADGVAGTLRLTVEIRAVNHRFFTPTIKLPSVLSRWESEVREALRQRFSRGHLTVTAWINRDVDANPTMAIDEARLAAYVTQLRGVRDKLGLAGDVDLATVLRLPDVITAERRDEQPLATPDELLAIVGQAADALAAMRSAEGARIEAYLSERLALVEEALGRISVRAPERLVEQRNRMQAAVTELLDGVAVDPQRVAQEIAILADRVDVAEELSRFHAHIAAFRSAMENPAGEAVGKRLGFLLQEMLREANTTGSKANDAAMLADVVAIKEELERLREQVENVE
jgi:uncharacterized protein (TIGR00255 family)